MDIDDPVLKYPKAPELPEGKVFVGWDRVEGDYLTIDSTTSAYEVNAYAADAYEGTFTVTFKLRNDRSITTTVPKNGVMPQFHIKEDDDGAWKFRYWKLTSGTMTSSRTILSDCVFTGVYDEIVDSAESEMLESADGQSSLSDLDRQLDSSRSQFGCEFFVSSSSGDDYCRLVGLDPTAYGEDFSELTKCPYINLLSRATNDFAPLKMIEIGDVELLLSALFKINIDIAHKEWFLKIDIPEATDYWYGYSEEYVEDNQTKTKWISFEPTVEYKFCNLHAANQVENGGLICSIK